MITSVDFSKFKGPLHIFKSIQYDDKDIEKLEEEQKELKEELGYIKKEIQEIDQKNNKRQ